MFTFLSSLLMMKQLTGFKKGYLLTRLVFHKGFHGEVWKGTPACPMAYNITDIWTTYTCLFIIYQKGGL